MLKDKRWLYPILCALLLNALVLASIFADMSDSATWAATLARSYRITPNITYLTANNWEAKLDVYQPTNASAPTPTLIYIHGGGWTVGNRQGAFFNTMPYIEMVRQSSTSATAWLAFQSLRQPLKIAAARCAG